MNGIPDKSVDMILADLPYGTTACSWDSIIDLDKLWLQYERVIKDNGAIVLTASQPFTTKLINSNKQLFKYDWIWHKTKGAFAYANYQPLRRHEHILIFAKNKTKYNPIMWEVSEERKDTRNTINNSKSNSEHTQNMNFIRKKDNGFRYPITILKFNSFWSENMHPTQKPVSLFEYLIKTYTNENDLVLDNTAGSGTTGVAAKNLNRNFILMEQEEEYIEIIKERLASLDE